MEVGCSGYLRHDKIALELFLTIHCLSDIPMAYWWPPTLSPEEVGQFTIGDL